jgi:hypothetical protein
VFVPVWGLHVTLLEGSVELTNLYLEKKYGLNDLVKKKHSASAISITDTFGGHTVFVIYAGLGDKEPIDYLRDLYHECLHMAYWMLDECKVKITPDNSEPLCYLQEYLVRECWGHLRKKKK